MIKFARMNTRRNGLLCAKSAFHGLTAGALSLMSDAFWREGFGPLLADAAVVPFGDLAALEKQLNTKRFAAFVVEPIQVGSGNQHCAARIFEGKRTRRFCRRTGTLFVVDEVQTGMFRTGKFLAGHQYGLRPDMVVLAKALSGGLAPSRRDTDDGRGLRGGLFLVAAGDRTHVDI